MAKQETKETLRRYSNSVKVTLIIVIAIFILVAVGVTLFLTLRTGTTINSNGIAQLKATPDIVSVYFSVETNGSNAKEAKDKNAEIVDRVLTELIKKGIERKNITTENFNIYPEYNWSSGTSVIIGYRASHYIKVQLSSNQIDKAGDVIDAGVDAGALISYINFELSQEKQNQYKAQALKLATEDARIKAESIASGLGKRIGNVISVQDLSFDYYPWPIYRNVDMIAGSAEAKSAMTNIQPGQQEINARVAVVFKLV